MKQVTRILALSMIWGLLVATSNGQTGAPGIKVKVPFGFAIGNTTLSAGQYLVLSSGDRIWIQDASARNVAVAYTGALDGKVPTKDGRVVFDCYSGECFLTQVWVAGQQSGRALAMSKRQTLLAKTKPTQEFTLAGRAMGR